MIELTASWTSYRMDHWAYDFLYWNEREWKYEMEYKNSSALYKTIALDNQSKENNCFLLAMTEKQIYNSHFDFSIRFESSGQDVRYKNMFGTTSDIHGITRKSELIIGQCFWLNSSHSSQNKYKSFGLELNC